PGPAAGALVAHGRLGARRTAEPAGRGGRRPAGAGLAGGVPPGHAHGLRRWTGLAAAAVRRALRSGRAVDRDGEPGFALPTDEDPVPAPEPQVALLPALDPTVVGWYHRRWYLGDHGPLLFDANGNAGPTVVRGRVVGGWAQAADREVRYLLREDIGSHTTASGEAAAAPLPGWLGPVRLAPRTRRRS